MNPFSSPKPICSSNESSDDCYHNYPFIEQIETIKRFPVSGGEWRWLLLYNFEGKPKICLTQYRKTISVDVRQIYFKFIL